MDRCRAEHFAVGAFNVDNQETLLAMLSRTESTCLARPEEPGRNRPARGAVRRAAARTLSKDTNAPGQPV